MAVGDNRPNRSEYLLSSSAFLAASTIIVGNGFCVAAKSKYDHFYYKAISVRNGKHAEMYKLEMQIGLILSLRQKKRKKAKRKKNQDKTQKLLNVASD